MPGATTDPGNRTLTEEAPGTGPSWTRTARRRPPGHQHRRPACAGPPPPWPPATGPAAVDAERASGFRYGQRAFLVQFRREGAGTWLIDPEPFGGPGPDQRGAARRRVDPARRYPGPPVPVRTRHVAGQTLRHRTGRTAGRTAARGPRRRRSNRCWASRLAKEHSAADWSTRPLPEPWLRYAALDVEVLAELREELIELLTADGKLEYAEQEFAAIRTPAGRRRASTRGARPPGCTRSATAASSPPCANSGSSATPWRRSATSPRAGSSRIPPSWPPPRPCPAPCRSCSTPRASTAGPRNARPRAGCAASARPAASRNSRRCTCPPTLPRRRASGPTGIRRPRHGSPPPGPAAGPGRGAGPAGRKPAHPGLPPPRGMASSRGDQRGRHCRGAPEPRRPPMADPAHRSADRRGFPEPAAAAAEGSQGRRGLPAEAGPDAVS